MNTKTMLGVSARVVLLFSSAIAFSFIGDYIGDFLGDWKCEGRYFKPDQYFGSYEGCDHYGSAHNAATHWGYRHWLFFIMGLVLFIIQAIDIVKYVQKK